MKNLGTSLALAFGLLISAGLPGWSVEADPPLRLMAITEVEAGNNGHFVVDAEINGSDIAVLVDTGASTVALSYEDAQRAGLRPNALNYDVQVSTANGTVKAARVKIRSVRIENVRVDNVDGMVLPKGALNGTLLGMSFLSRLQSFRVEDGRLVLKN
jgi:aspartyl protease family protein